MPTNTKTAQEAAADKAVGSLTELMTSLFGAPKKSRVQKFGEALTTVTGWLVVTAIALTIGAVAVIAISVAIHVASWVL